MNHKQSSSIPIAAERRRLIYNWALKHGSVNVVELAESLGVGTNTIRRDLDVLHEEGKLIRSHGGAVIKDGGNVRPEYSQIRNTNIEQKSWIGEAALAYLPEMGSILIGSGSTAYQMVVRLPQDFDLHVITPSPETAIQLALATVATVDLLGGRVRRDAYDTDCSLSEEALQMLYWDVTFMGVSAIDPVRGITSLDRSAALYEQKAIEHGSKVVVLCDSSKIGQFSYAKVGPANLADVLITDCRADKDAVDEFRNQGIEVVVTGPGEEINVIQQGN